MLEGLAYSYPTSSPLPKFRLSGERAFKYVGIDFCGPVFVKIGKETDKGYIALITCAVTRMVHLELMPDLTSNSLVNCLKRFTSRRGVPKLFVSDNAKTFKSRLLNKFRIANNIKWMFNLAKAAWWGGLFERLIRSTKRCLKKCIRNLKLSYD